MNSGVGFKNVHCSIVFQRFWAATGPFCRDSEVDSGMNSGVGVKNIDF